MDIYIYVSMCVCVCVSVYVCVRVCVCMCCTSASMSEKERALYTFSLRRACEGDSGRAQDVHDCEGRDGVCVCV